MVFTGRKCYCEKINEIVLLVVVVYSQCQRTMLTDSFAILVQWRSCCVAYLVKLNCSIPKDSNKELNIKVNNQKLNYVSFIFVFCVCMNPVLLYFEGLQYLSGYLKHNIFMFREHYVDDKKNANSLVLK